VTKAPINPIEEDQLGERLRVAIDALPARSVALRGAAPVKDRPTSGPLVVAGVGALSAVALVVALVIGAALSEHRAALGSPAPSTVAADRYGLIVQAGGPVVRAENDPASIAQLYQEPQHRGPSELRVVHAVSPEGRRVAYWIWTPSPPGLGSLAITRLVVFDASSGAIRDLVALSKEAGSGVVWSTDGSGLLLGVVASVGPDLNGPNLARLRTVDLVTGRTSDVGPAIGADGASGGAFEPTTSQIAGAKNVTIRPLLWDRAADRIVALVAAGNPNYASSVLIIDRGTATSYPLIGEFLTGTVALSPDGKRLAGARTRDFALVVWDVDNYANREEIVPASGERILSLVWRPGTDQLFFMHDNALTTDPVKWSRLERWRPGVEPARVVNATPGPAIIFRFDGSAYLMSRDLPTAASYDIIESESGVTIGSISNVRIAGTLLLPPMSTR
jgi:hypothetical protein